MMSSTLYVKTLIFDAALGLALAGDRLLLIRSLTKLTKLSDAALGFAAYKLLLVRSFDAALGHAC